MNSSCFYCISYSGITEGLTIITYNKIVIYKRLQIINRHLEKNFYATIV
jgi:hypothetical protein